MFRPLLLGFAISFAGIAGAADFKFDQSSSSLMFSGDYEGEAIEGKFAVFIGVVSFDLSAPRNPLFDVKIQTKSLDTAYEERDEVLRDQDWFASVKYPEAIYKSAGPCKKRSAVLLCPGNLTLRGISKPVTLQVTIDTKSLSVVGSAQFKRRDFGVGQGEWDESATIGDQISVKFKLGLKPSTAK